MSDVGLAMVGNELGFLWDDQQNQFSWENLSTSKSENSSGGGGGGGEEEEEEDKSVGQSKMLVSDGGPNGNYKKAGRAAGEGPASNKKGGRGGVCKNNNNNNIGNNNKNSSDGGKKVGVVGESDHEIHIWTERERRKKMRNMFANLHALLPQLPSKADKSTIVDEAVNYIKALEETYKELKKRKLDKLHGTSTSTSTITSASGYTYEPLSLSPSILIPQQNKQACYNDTLITREAFLADQGSVNDSVTMGNNANTSNSVQHSRHHHNHVVPHVTFQTWTSSNAVLNVLGNEAHISVCSAKKPGLLSSICYVLEKNKLGLVSAQVSSDGVRNMYMIHALLVTREAFLADQGSVNDSVTMGNNANTSNSVQHSRHHHNHVVPHVTFQTWTSSNAVLNVLGNEAHISVCSAKKPGLLSSICYVLEKNKLGLVSAQVSSDGVRNMYMIHARANTTGASDQFEGLRSVEEVFKQAVGEIMFWISS